MSARILQRIVVRMLFDQTFMTAVYEDPDGALAKEDISVQERAWLVAADRRRWRADPHRNARALHGLVEEFPVSAAVYCRAHKLETLFDYFASSTFHRCIMNGDSLACQFGHWLSSRLEDASPVATLETMICARRRQTPRDIQTNTRWALALHVDADMFPLGTLAYYETVRRVLGSDASEVLKNCLDGTRHLVSPYEPRPDSEALVIELGPTGGIGHASEALAELLILLRDGASEMDVLNHSMFSGMSSDEVIDVVTGLVADGLVLDVGP